MVASIVKLQALATTSDQTFARPVPERGLLRPPAATYLPRVEIESQATFGPIGIDDPPQARPGLHDPEKGPSEQNSHHSHSLPYNHSRVTYAEDEGDDDGPKQHTGWVLVGNPTSAKITSH